MVLGKRILAGALACLMAVALCVPAYAEADCLPPELLSASVKQEKAVPGGSVTVQVQAADAGTGVRSVAVSFRSEESGHLLSTVMTSRDHVGATSFAKDLKLPEGTPGGRYVLVLVTVNDNAGNSRDYRAQDELRERDSALPLAECPAFTVQSAESAQKPALESIELGSASAAAGGKLSVTVTASGAERINLTFRRAGGESVAEKLYLTLRKEHRVSHSAGADTYRASLEPDTQLAAGRFELASARVTSASGAFEEYRPAAELTRDGTQGDYLPLPQEAGFEVLRKNSADGEPPVLQSVEVSAAAVKAGASVRITVRASDAASGLKQISLRFVNEDNGRALTAELLAQNAAGGVAELQIPAGEPAGTYRLERVSLTDEAGNRAWYGRAKELSDHKGWLEFPQEPCFTVENNGATGKAELLSLESVALDGAAANAPGEMGVRVCVNANRKVERLYLRFYNEENSHSLTTVLTAADYDAATNSYRGFVAIPAQEKTGWFELVALTMTDEAGNRQSYCTAERMSYGDAEDDSDYFSEDRMVLAAGTAFYVDGQDG